MNTAALWPDEAGRRLYQEIGMIEEQHVSQYGSLLNPTMSWLENLLVHQFTECYLYWSCYETETDRHIKDVWDFMLQQELMHLHIAQNLLKEYEGKEWQQVIPDACFPAPLVLESNIDYVRRVLGGTVNLTAKREEYVDVCEMKNGTFHDYPIAVAGKTGTAQHGITTASDHGAFVCYAPADSTPKIAIAVYGERAGHGGSLAIVARDMLDVYFEVGDLSDVPTYENKAS